MKWRATRSVPKLDPMWQRMFRTCPCHFQPRAFHLQGRHSPTSSIPASIHLDSMQKSKSTQRRHPPTRPLKLEVLVACIVEHPSLGPNPFTIPCHSSKAEPTPPSCILTAVKPDGLHSDKPTLPIIASNPSPGAGGRSHLCNSSRQQSNKSLGPAQLPHQVPESWIGGAVGAVSRIPDLDDFLRGTETVAIATIAIANGHRMNSKRARHSGNSSCL
ncbi:hypothetical protein B0T10DRAFT_42479 [Thelonectria olida]|uniref:Uncharacterized protein n=1 Tax=Thelonectria olida TaxID=1576542 RepID=A0A9P9AM89_9HYPO|nr:hypothetical protein B0T10DRAFT_42479 [Thelonectria olida]